MFLVGSCRGRNVKFARMRSARLGQVMLLDLSRDRLNDEIYSDLCIIGSGAAGLTIATQMIGRSTQVLLLEAGGLDFSPASQAVYEGQTKGQPAFPLESMRLRYFGGSTNHWTGLCRPLEESDFVEKDWVPNSGWPIRKADLDPYVLKTHEILDLNTVEYSLSKLALPGSQYFPLAPNLFDHHVWRLSTPTRFGQKYKVPMEKAPNIKVLLNANVFELVLDPSGKKIVKLTYKDPSQKIRTVKAGHFVLAAGGIENARLLLASRSVNHAGVGNDRDLVGRYYNDHPHVYTGTMKLFSKGDAELCASSYAIFKSFGNEILPAVAMSPNVQKKEKTLANAFSLFLNRNLDASKGYMALRRLLSGKSDKANAHTTFWDDLTAVWQDLDGASVGLYNKAKSIVSTTEEFKLLTRAEQAPNPDSRVLLNDQLDSFGMPRVTLDWQLTPLDKHTIFTANTAFASEIGRLGLGRVHLPEWLLSPGMDLGTEFHPGSHHMGTTRMASSPAKGVVDANCKVFGLANLYVAGSSVFTTGGYANPTFTIVQLALRLSDHLKLQLKA